MMGLGSTGNPMLGCKNLIAFHNSMPILEELVTSYACFTYLAKESRRAYP